MNLKELIDACRDDIDDTTAPYLFSRARLVRFANEAQVEACRRSRLIVDSETPDICSHAVVIAREIITLDPRVIFVRKAKLASKTVKLGKATRTDMDNLSPGWEDTTGEVSGWISDYQSGVMRLYPIPTVADTLELTVVREPLMPMAKDEDLPEIAPRYHEKLIHWMRYRCYETKDAETTDPKAALKALALFEQEFGTISSAQNEAWIHTQHGQDDFDGVY